MIVDLILEHFNIQSLQGEKEILTGEQFSQLIEMCEDLYYEKLTKGSETGIA
tara:strand:- start:664 stop:819 length:156 start_codon:yes stop_codon:yes gene_type:complete